MKIIRPPETPPEPVSRPSPDTLGGKIWITLSEALSDAVRIATHPLAVAFQWGVEYVLDLVRVEAKEATGPLINRIRNEPTCPPEIKHLLDWLMEAEGQAVGALLGAVGSSAVSGVTGSVLGALLAPVTTEVQRAVQGTLVDPATILMARIRKILNPEETHEELRKHGFNANARDLLNRINYQDIGVDSILQLWMRGEIDDTQLFDRLNLQAIRDVDVADLKKLTQQIPGPGGLVSMAVREAWDEEFAARWGSDQAFPAPFAEWMEKQGFSQEWSKRFWRAHWGLPSLLQGFEMFHRENISEEELRELLKVQDVLPGYRDPLIQIAYRPYTRVDVRRMYGLEVLGREDVKTAYKHLGYDEEKAENMTKFTIRYETQAERELTKGDVLDGYRKELIPPETVNDMLTALGYSAEIISFYLAREDLKKAQERKAAMLKSVKSNYVSGIWDIPETSAALGPLALPAAEEAKLINDWDVERVRRISRPGVGQVIQFFDNAIITEGEFRNELDIRGYSAAYVQWYTENLETVKQERLERETEAEQRRLLSQIRKPSKAELRVFWTAGIVTELEFRSMMVDQGYTDNDIRRYVDLIELQEAKRLERETEADLKRRLADIKHPSKTDLKAFLKVGIISPDQMRNEMLLQGFEPAWVTRYIELFIPTLEE